MAADITYEGLGSIVKVKADVANGWRRLKNTFGYWDSARAPFRGDITLKVQIEVAARPNHFGNAFDDFPLDLQGEFGSETLHCRLRTGVLDVRFVISDSLPWRWTKSRDPEVFWDAYPVASVGRVAFALRFWAIFMLPNGRKAGDVRDWDTQFCSGGLPSLGKR